MARLLLIVSRTEPARYAYFKHVFSSETVEVIVDRRQSERRRGEAPVERERRRRDRRVQGGVTTDLQAFGWALVRH